MSVQELEQAVAHLPPEEFRAFGEWFLNIYQERWELQLERDANHHKLNALADAALQDFKMGRCKPL